MASDTEEQQVVSKSKWPEFLRPNRGWFLAAAGGVAAYLIDHLNAPLWLALAVLVLLLAAGGIYPWISKNKKRHIAFWAVLSVCAVAAVVTLKSSGKVVQQPPKKELPAFAVDIEHRIFTVPGPYGTSFWFGTFLFSKCSLEPTGAAIFLRITNLQRQKEMITAYSIDGLPKTPVTHGRMYIILPKGQVGSGFTPHIIDWGAPAGLGAMVHFSVDDADTSKAIPVTGDFLDYKIGEGHYLEPDEPVRGWVFFEYRKGYAEMPAHLTINITDQFQHSFTYPIPDHVGDPEGDILPRRIVEGPLEDLSRCVVYK